MIRFRYTRGEGVMLFTLPWGLGDIFEPGSSTPSPRAYQELEYFSQRPRNKLNEGRKLLDGCLDVPLFGIASRSACNLVPFFL